MTTKNPGHVKTVRLNETEQAMLQILSLARSQSDVLREGLYSVWKDHGIYLLEKFRIVYPERAEKLETILREIDVS